ncbi:cytochrome P450 [Amycolatopsis japonica]|uniref:cytochrome P450 n=1 Tax=Amycolatopsis japonica TaxID=208439 RepID=UPI00366BD7FD
MNASPPPVVSGARPVVGHAVEFFRDPVALLWRGHREHGNLFSFVLPWRRVTVLLGAEHSRFFYAETDGALSIREAYPFFQRMFGRDFYFMGSEQDYMRQRDLVLPRFRGTQVADYVTAMEAETQQFLARIGSEGEFDLIAEMGPLVMRIAARCFLGPDLARRMNLDFFEEFRVFSNGMGYVPGWLPLPKLIRSRRSRDRLRRARGDVIAQREASPVEPPDFLQVLAEATYPDGTPAPLSVRVNLMLLLTWAGHETTAGHLSWALADLVDHPADLRRVREESAAVLARGPLDLAATQNLSHLDDCLHETERLHPVAFIQGRLAAEDFELDGCTVAKGSLVLVSPAVTHRLPDTYEKAEEFVPGRGKADRQALIGFGGGTHRCLGVRFAYLEMKTILAHLLTELDMELLDGFPEPVPGYMTKWPSSPCRVRFRSRTSVRSSP